LHSLSRSRRNSTDPEDLDGDFYECRVVVDLIGAAVDESEGAAVMEKSSL
jgi:hypothetical protein